MKCLFVIVLINLSFQCELFSQTKVPQYVENALKKETVKRGTFRSYNFDEAKKRPNDVIELDLNQLGLAKCRSK